MNFSVLMSVYAKEKPTNLEECLSSLEGQTLKADEIVLVEDGPISNELKLVIEKHRQNLNIVSVVLAGNMGLAMALNEGLKYCKHDLVARMDTDDICLPERFKKQVTFMRANPNVVASSAQLEEWDELFSKKINTRHLPCDHQSLMKIAQTRSPLSHPLVMFRKQVVVDAGGYPPLRKAQDYALWSVLLQQDHTFANLPDTLLKMRTGDGLFERRGLEYFKYEAELLKFQHQINFLSTPIYLRNLFLKAVLRLSPRFAKRLAYKYAR